MNRMLMATLVALTATPVAMLPIPQAHAAPADAVCMADTAGNRGRSAQLIILATPQTTPSLTARGYAARPCAGREANIAAYRARVCEQARSVPQAAQAGFQAVYKVSLTELCLMAISLEN